MTPRYVTVCGVRVVRITGNTYLCCLPANCGAFGVISRAPDLWVGRYCANADGGTITVETRTNRTPQLAARALTRLVKRYGLERLVRGER